MTVHSLSRASVPGRWASCSCGERRAADTFPHAVEAIAEHARAALAAPPSAIELADAIIRTHRRRAACTE